MSSKPPREPDQGTHTGKPSDTVPPTTRRELPVPVVGDLTVRTRGRLPHHERDSGTYFVTFRLGDSLPQDVINSYTGEREDIVATARALGRELTLSEEARLSELFGERIEHFLDRGVGACHLETPAVAELVKAALLHFHGERYRVFAWCVMPNHVHVIFRALPGHGLACIVHSWKSYTAKRANRLLRRTGKFWQREYYDHLVRDEADFCRVVNYILRNPQKAGLRDWRWLGSCISGAPGWE